MILYVNHQVKQKFCFDVYIYASSRACAELKFIKDELKIFFVIVFPTIIKISSVTPQILYYHREAHFQIERVTITALVNTTSQGRVLVKYREKVN